MDNVPPPNGVARCGGPSLCFECSAEVISAQQPRKTESTMEFTTFVRKPFPVEAVEITVDNIEELAPLVGTLREKDGKPYIQVNKQLVPNLFRVHPGFFLTRMGDNVRCYSKRIFAEQFMPMTPELEELVANVNGT